MAWTHQQKNSSTFSTQPKSQSVFSNQLKNNSSFVESIKNRLISFLLWTDLGGESQGYLLYTDGSGDTGRIILEDHSFADLPKHPSIFNNQIKHTS